LETALLSPYAAVCELQAVLLTGGSAPALSAAAGVTSFLREGGYGYVTRYARIPLVSAAVIYDLGLGSPNACPSADDAYQAARGAGSCLDEGSVGVGTGASVGKILGRQFLMKGGVALSSVEVGAGVTVSALTVVNALGDVLDEGGSILAGVQSGGEFLNSVSLLLGMTAAPSFGAIESTTLSVVMTDGRLDKQQCSVIARMSHAGLARAVNPVHTPVDGDAIFVLSSGKRPTSVFQVGAAAAEAVAASVRRAVRVSESLGGAVSVRDLDASNR